MVGIFLLHPNISFGQKIIVDISKKDSIMVCAGQILELVNDSTKADTTLCSSQGTGTIKWKNGTRVVGRPVSKYVTPPMMGDSTYTWNYVDASGNQKSCCAVRTFKVKVIPKPIITWAEDNNIWGYDQIATSDSVYINMPFDSFNNCKVTISPFIANLFYITSNDSNIKINNSYNLLASSSTLNLRIDAKSKKMATDTARESLLLLQCNEKEGVKLDTLFVEQYAYRLVDSIYYFRIWDSTSPTTLPLYDPIFQNVLDSINIVYRQLNFKFDHIGGKRLEHVRFDLNNNGYIDYYNGTLSNPERDAIENFFIGYVDKGVIHATTKFSDNWRIIKSALIGKDTVELESVTTLAIGDVFDLGRRNIGGINELITIKDIIGNKIVLTDTLKHSYLVLPMDTPTIYGNLSGLSTTPPITTNAVKLETTMTHEILHLSFSGNLTDLFETDNIMYSKASATKRKLRYRAQEHVVTGTSRKTGGIDYQWIKFRRK